MIENCIIPNDCTMISALRDREVQEFLDNNKISAFRSTRWWNHTIWQFSNPQDRTLFLLKWIK